MKILHIAQDDFSPGANRAAYRLHKSIQSLGIESTFLVAEKKTDDESVVCDKRRVRIVLGRVYEKVLNKLYKKNQFSIFSHNKISAIKKDGGYYNQFDIIQLHWIGASTFSWRELRKINNPVIWRIPDLLAFTGGCHYSKGCQKFMSVCYDCHWLESGLPFDIAKYNFYSKRKAYVNKELHIVSPSIWLYELVQKSELLKDAKKYNIRTGVDTKLFAPMDSIYAKKLLGLNIPSEKKTILFGAMSSTYDPRKGFEYLHHALHKLDKDKYHFLVFGSSGNEELKKEFSNISFIGSFYDEVSMKLVYNTSDVMVVPSTEDNLPNTAIEAMACGKPVVSFSIGGLPDLISHKQDGYLSKPFESNDLAFGIEWILNASNYYELCVKAREKVLQKFDSKVVAESYLKLYTHLLL